VTKENKNNPSNVLSSTSMTKFLCLLTIATATIGLEARLWRSAKGDQQFEADHISNDGNLVTLKKGSRIVSFPIAKLHEVDQAWLVENHPLARPSAIDAPAPPKGAAFDTLEFGDTRKDVIAKLKVSKMVEGGAADVMMARIGLNGAYRTKNTIGGLHCYLYFGWTKNNTLREVTLRSKVVERGSYGGMLKNNWEEMTSVLTMLHGRPVQGTPYPNSDELQDGLILCSHLWRTEEGHSVLLGTGQEGKKYTVIVRITSERIEPVVVK